jgi:two-component system, LytTR family, sensor kinase
LCQYNLRSIDELAAVRNDIINFSIMGTLHSEQKTGIFYGLTALAFVVISLLSELVHSTSQYRVKIFNELWLVVFVTVINFFFFEYSLPFIRKRIRPLIMGLPLALVILFPYLLLYTYGVYGWRTLGIWLHAFSELKDVPTMDAGLGVYFGYSLAALIFFGIVKQFYEYNKLKLSAQKLTIEKQKAELSFLKSQTNPHFLFNTLNNIYSLARDKSDLAPESVLRLSKILRYMLYEAAGSRIAIEEELKIISDYISLEKLRYDDSLHVELNAQVEDGKQTIPPLLIMPLVENAFKHGASETSKSPFVRIHLVVNKRQFKLVVENSTGVGDGRAAVTENIGLSNLRRQLELLFKSFDLSFKKNESVFTATLLINLTSHV